MDKGVNKGLIGTIRQRVDTILQDHKLKWSDVYNKLGLSKAHASMIRNGHIIPPDWLRVKIARDGLGCDSSCIWKVQDLLEKQNTKKESEQKQNSGLNNSEINKEVEE